MTPREIAGHLEFDAILDRIEAAERISIGALAARGDPRELKRIIKEAEKG